MRIDIERLSAEIDELSAISEWPAPAVTRVLFSPEDMRARAWFVEKCQAAGLSVRTDAVGNIFARREGTEPGLRALATGSHTDAIPNAGKFDGVVGVLGGLEAIRALDEAGHQLRHPIELIFFTAEEPTRFGIGCLGSRLLAGTLAPDQADSLVDRNGRTLAELREAANFQGALGDVRLEPGHYAAFLELHIEQGPTLERESLDIGVVEKIAAPAAWRVTFSGEGGHAGAVLMPERHDAGLGAAEAALALERFVLASESPDTVGTTGVVRLHPGAINSIPCEAVLEMDIRDTQLPSRDLVLENLDRALHEIAARRGLKVAKETISEDPPATCDPRLLEAIERAAAGLKSRRMISRAYHDSLFMARIAPTAMIFIPCRNGWSHRPDEFSSPTQIQRGVEVLARTLVEADAGF
ncbi:MAG: M20 family metallo-hydrolase [Terrimicrobiaceae bacterium]|nr:M20 family metallo-hydrolase [Terrimicrobiaceae bacterium]